MDALPHWPDGTVAVLTTHPAHAIPVSLAMRAGDREIVLGLAPGRESLANLREDPRCAVTIIAAGLAFTAYGTARIMDSDPVVSVRIEVGEIVDHAQDTFEITAGVAWRWTDEEGAQRDADARDSLRRLAP
jgi:hypothetical protein